MRIVIARPGVRCPMSETTRSVGHERLVPLQGRRMRTRLLAVLAHLPAEWSPCCPGAIVHKPIGQSTPFKAADGALTPRSWAALLPLPAPLDALVTGLAFLLLARLVLERSAQAGGLPLLLLGHGDRPLLAPTGIVQVSRRRAARRFSALRPPMRDRRSSRGAPPGSAGCRRTATGGSRADGRRRRRAID